MSSKSKSYPDVEVTQPRKGVDRWFLPFKRDVGTWGYVLNRLAGIGLVVYLYLHLFVLSTLLRGPEAWNQFRDRAATTPFLLLDVILIAGLLGHGLNGLRVALVGSGVLASKQRSLFYIFIAIALILFIVGSALLFIL